MMSLNRLYPAVLACTCFLLVAGCPLNPFPGETRVFDGIEFVWIPPGTFVMGSPTNEADRLADETQHQVTISTGFWLGKYEVTQAQWKSVMGNNPSGFSGPNKPVELVSWEDAQDFIGTLNASVSVTGGPYRLPTESEWEYAYRAKTATRFYWGDDSMGADIGDYAWYYDNSGYKTHKVGQKLPNSWGLYDMAGGVFEWCKDWYGDYPAGPVTDPQGAGPNLGARVVRGGCWKSFPLECRAAMRGGSVPDQRFTLIGFRLVRTED